jgi:transposase-like protein
VLGVSGGRRYDINANLLFKWKRQDEAGELGGPPGPGDAWRAPG